VGWGERGDPGKDGVLRKGESAIAGRCEAVLRQPLVILSAIEVGLGICSFL
jgi:hypothetical protein